MWLRLANVLLLLALVLLGQRLMVGDGGRSEIARLQLDLQQKRVEIQRLAERNQSLAAEVADLKTGFAAIEELARFDLGMIGKREVFYQIVTDDDQGELLAN